MPLTDAEKKELECLEDPRVEFMTPAGGVVAIAFEQLSSNSQNKRKDRVVELRAKLRMEELRLDEKKDWQKYYKIRAEEEKRFDEGFKK
jgi:hypothetical protein